MKKLLHNRFFYFVIALGLIVVLHVNKIGAPWMFLVSLLYSISMHILERKKLRETLQQQEIHKKEKEKSF